MMHVEHVSAHYKTITGPVLAIEDVNFAIHDDEIFGIAGESGCGKSTLLKILYDVLRFPLEFSGLGRAAQIMVERHLLCASGRDERAQSRVPNRRTVL